MRRRLEENRSELALLRGKVSDESVAQWVNIFGGGDSELGRRYALAVEAFLGPAPERGAEGQWKSYTGHLSPHTRSAYAFALGEFFEWIARARGRVLPPHEVRTQDIEDYANWLATRPYSLEVEKLSDGDQDERLAIYEVIRRIGQSDIRSIAAALPEEIKAAHRSGELFDVGWLDTELGRMVLHDAIVRSPTFDELRAEYPRAGIDQFAIPVPTSTGDVREVPIEEVFIYRLPEPKAVSRTTIVARLAALSSFWDVLARGENVAGGEPILKHNIIKPVKKRVSRGLAAEKRAGAQARNQRTSAEVVVKLLRAADAGTTLSEKRDRALLYFLVFTGVRVDEALRVRRGAPLPSEENRWPAWFDGESVVLMRKGGRRATLPFPPIALRPLEDFQAAIAARAAPEGAQQSEPNAPKYLHPDSPRWRYRELSVMPDAPLFPAVSFWGANSSYNYQEFKPNQSRTGIDYRRPMTRHGVTKLLGRLAVRAELTDAERRTVHPHALRHFAATAMAQGGKDLREIQAMLGHSSIITTESYIAGVEGKVELSGQAEILETLARAETALPPPAARPAGRPAPVIETRAEAVPEPEEAPAELVEPPDVEAPILAAEVPPAAEQLPANRIAQNPVNDEPSARVSLTDGEPIVEIRGAEPPMAPLYEVRRGVSPGSPEAVYEALEPGSELSREEIAFTMVQRRISPRKGLLKKGVTIETKEDKGEKIELVQKNMWLLDHYDPWPLHYGVGESSLLVWYAKGSPSLAEGTVKRSIRGRSLEIPPLPVLAPEQVYPETGGRLLGFVERLYERWLTGDPASGEPPSPTRTYGLVRWYGFFAMATARLERFLDEQKAAHPIQATRPRWVPFDAVGDIGKEVRAHKDEWIEAWFEKNAHTYTTTYKAFEKVPRGRGEDPEKFWEAFALASFEGALPMAQGTALDDIPAWFASADPVHEIYERDPDEWERFVVWLQNVTGDKLTRARERDRSDQERYAQDELQSKRDKARELLKEYYRAVDLIGLLETNLRTGANEDEAIVHGDSKSARIEALDEAKTDLDWIGEALASYGIEPREKYRDLPRKERIARMLADAFPEQESELAAPNMLAGSALFDPRAFAIDADGHTIVHDEPFKREFFERYGRDSELVMRRAARAMWEHVGGEIPEEKRARADRYSLIYSIMLSYIAWVVPAPAEMERRMAEAGLHAAAGAASTKQWLTVFVGALRDAIYVPTSAEGIETEGDLLDYIMREKKLDRQSAEEVLKSLKIRMAFTAETESGAALEQQLAAELGGEEPSLRIRGRRSRAKPEETSAPPGAIVLKPGIVKRKGQLVANAPRPVFVFVAGESCERWYATTQLPDDGEFTPNARGAVYLSPGAWAAFRANLGEPAAVLPSPFRMIAAMAEGDGL